MSSRARQLPWFIIISVLLMVTRVSYGDAPKVLDLESALALAGEHNRLLQVARLRIQEAEGDLVGASIGLINNPEFAVAAGPRSPEASAVDSTTDAEVVLGQRLEIGGQRDHRIEQTDADIVATRASAAAVQRAIELAVTTAFFETLAAQQRPDLWLPGSLLFSWRLHRWSGPTRGGMLEPSRGM